MPLIHYKLISVTRRSDGARCLIAEHEFDPTKHTLAYAAAVTVPEPESESTPAPSAEPEDSGEAEPEPVMSTARSARPAHRKRRG